MPVCIQGIVCWHVFKGVYAGMYSRNCRYIFKGVYALVNMVEWMLVCVQSYSKGRNCRYVFKELYVLVIMIAPVAVSMLVCGRHGRVHAGML